MELILNVRTFMDSAIGENKPTALVWVSSVGMLINHLEIVCIQNAHWLSAPSKKSFYRQFGDSKAR